MSLCSKETIFLFLDCFLYKFITIFSGWCDKISAGKHFHFNIK
nr:MAG TPA: hypothetical protein [Caudoviricetes sp.]